MSVIFELSSLKKLDLNEKLNERVNVNLEYYVIFLLYINIFLNFPAKTWR